MHYGILERCVTVHRVNEQQKCRNLLLSVNVLQCRRCAKEVCELYWLLREQADDKADVVLLNVYKKLQEIKWSLIQIK